MKKHLKGQDYRAWPFVEEEIVREILMVTETVVQLQQRKIKDTTTHNLVEADATGVPAEKSLHFSGC